MYLGIGAYRLRSTPLSAEPARTDAWKLVPRLLGAAGGRSWRGKWGWWERRVEEKRKGWEGGRGRNRGHWLGTVSALRTYLHPLLRCTCLPASNCLPVQVCLPAVPPCGL